MSASGDEGGPFEMFEEYGEVNSELTYSPSTGQLRTYIHPVNHESHKRYEVRTSAHLE